MSEIKPSDEKAIAFLYKKLDELLTRHTPAKDKLFVEAEKRPYVLLDERDLEQLEQLLQPEKGQDILSCIKAVWSDEVRRMKDGSLSLLYVPDTSMDRRRIVLTEI